MDITCDSMVNMQVLYLANISKYISNK